MSDLEGQVSLPTGSAEQDAAKVEKGFKKIAEAARLAKRESIDYQREAGRFFKGMQSHGESAAHSMHQLRHSIRFVGEQFELSGVTGGRGIAGALALNGAFARVAGGAALAGLALKAYDAVVEADAERHEMATKAVEAYYEAIKSGSSEINKHAKAGLGQTNDIRSLVALGGPEAVAAADQLAADPRNGVTGQQARRGMSRAYTLRPDIRQEAIRSALAANKTGLVGFDEALEEISKDRRLQGILRGGVTAYDSGAQGSDIALGQSRDLVLGSLLSGPLGRKVSAKEAGGIYDNIANPGSANAFLEGSNKAQAVLNGIDLVDRNGVAGGTAEGVARGELAAAMNPVARALADLAIAQTRLSAALEQKARDQSLGAGLVGAATGGTATNKYLRHLDATSNVGGG
jgi:hypothetical protein